MTLNKTKASLNQLVADLSVMYDLLHQTHWYMRGKGFLTLHPMLDDWMDDIDEQLDEVAERLITIDGSPYSTPTEFAEHSGIKMEKGSWDLTINERFTILAEAYKYIIDTYKAGIAAAQEEEDVVTEDIYTGFLGATEKRYWMIRAQLGQEPDLA